MCMRSWDVYIPLHFSRGTLPDSCQLPEPSLTKEAKGVLLRTTPIAYLPLGSSRALCLLTGCTACPLGVQLPLDPVRAPLGLLTGSGRVVGAPGARVPLSSSLSHA